MWWGAIILNPIEKFKVPILHMKRDWNHWHSIVEVCHYLIIISLLCRLSQTLYKRKHHSLSGIQHKICQRYRKWLLLRHTFLHMHNTPQIVFWLICNSLSNGRLAGASLWLIDCLNSGFQQEWNRCYINLEMSFYNPYCFAWHIDYL